MLKLQTIDFQALPVGLLSAVKQHVRVEFARDDGYLTEATARAIAEVESVTNLSINPATWVWQPSLCEPSWNKVPKAPVRQVDILDNAGQVVSTIELVYNGTTAYLPDTADQSGTYQIQCGYLAVADIPPVVLNPILMLVGTLYEHREAVQMGTFTELPDMANRLLSGLWRPSV